ncbi:MAG TPA: DUF1475 family protein [bacterium]
MLTFLKILFFAILATMLYVTITASLDRGVFDAGAALWPDPWFRATLADAYFGFLTFFVWVAYKEHGFLRKAVWFVLIMTLGNIAMAVYVLIQLFRLPGNAPLRHLLLRKTHEI